MVSQHTAIETLLLDLNKAEVELWVEEGKLRSRAPEGAITPALRDQIRLHKETIIAFLEKQKTATKRVNLTASIPLAPPQDDYVLSNAQRRLWVANQMESQSIAYNIPTVLRLKGILNSTALEQSFQLLIDRHEILRTNFIDNRQVIAPFLDFSLPLVDCTDVDATYIQEQITQHANYIFDLEKDNLLRLKLLKKGETEHILLINMHHIISDGWSVGIIIQELTSLYNACNRGIAQPLSLLSPLSIQYKDYATWQEELLQTEKVKPLQQFWLETLTLVDGQLPTLDLPTDFPRPAVKTTNGANCTKRLNQNLTEEFKQWAQQHEATLFMGLTALLKILFYRYTGQTDQIIGTPSAGRNHPDLQTQIGFYVNTLVLRNQVQGQASFTAFLKRVKENTLQAFDNEFYPFDQLVEELNLPVDRSRSPIFDVMIVLQNNEKSDLKLGEVTIIPEATAFQVSRFDLAFKFSEDQQGLSLSIEYNTDLYKKDRVERLISHFETLLESVLADSEAPIEELNILPKAEKQLLLKEFNNTEAAFPADKTVIDLFEEQVRKHPTKVALVFEEKEWTYQEINSRANQIGQYLKKQYQLKPNDIVALQLERSEWTAITILGILKAGAVYLPIATNMPVARVNFILEKSQAKLLIADTPNFTNAKAKFENYLPIINIANTPLADYSTEKMTTDATALDLAVVMFTSGSTGEPKGVCIQHQNISRLVKGRDYIDYNEELVFLHHSDYSFDALTLELWPPLLNGAKLVIMPRGERTIESLSETIQQYQVNIVWITAGLFHLMVDKGIEELTSLRYLMSGGDTLSVTHIKKAIQQLPNTTIINGYGPTENTVFTTICKTNQLDEINHTVPIGKPIANTEVFILDDEQRLMPIGFPGELCTSGKGLAKGYLNNPTLTAQKFIPHPFKAGERLYRTGDLARWLPDGNIEFLGRVDFQLKVRGYLIETTEIEQTLLEHKAVESVVVIGVPIEQTGHKELVAYIVTPDKTLFPSITILKTFLEESLPTYMIPSYFVELETFPLTNRGKVNRNALPVPQLEDLETDTPYIAPETATEKKLAEIWANLLAKKTIGVQDNFFDIGGNSLRALRLLSFIKQEFSERISLTKIFAHPTIQQLAQLIEEQTNQQTNSRLTAIPVIELQDSYELSHAQRRLWVLHQLEGMQSAYNIPTAIKLKGQLNIAALEKSIQLLFERHEILRTYFINGRQVIRPIIDWKLPITDYSSAEESTIYAAIQAQQTHIFDLEKDLLLKIELLKIAPTEHLLLFNAHHIIFDGWSMGILTKELSTLYTTFSQDTSPTKSTLPPLSIQYKEYAAWQHQLLSGKLMTPLKEYWVQKLATTDGLLPTLDLPTDFPRPLVKTARGAHLKKMIAPAKLQQLKTLFQAQDATLFMGLAALIKTLLYRYTGQTDIIIGTPTAGRNHPDLHEQIGVYINMLVLRNQLTPTSSFSHFLQQVKTTSLEAFEHEQYPFDQLVEDLELARDMSRSAVFDVVLMVQNNEVTDLELGNLAIEPQRSEAVASKFDITFSFTENENGLHFNVEYSTDLFEAATIQRLIQHFEALVESVLTAADTPITQLNLLTKEEKLLVTEAFNQTKQNYPAEKTFIELFEAQVEKTPDKIALIFEPSEEQKGCSLTYRQLNQQANQLGHFLQEKYKLQAEDIVALQLDRSEWMIIAILGVMKAGAAYLPIAPDFPKNRVNFMLQDATAKVLLTDEKTAAISQQYTDILSVEKIDSINGKTLSKANPIRKNHAPHSLAYILYTSGSTGNPKGVMIEHQALVNFLWSMQQQPGLVPQDILLSITNYTFDISILEYGLPLINGAQLVLASANQQTNPALLEALIAKTKPTFFQATPSLWSILLTSEIPGLEKMKLLCGGEALPTQLAEKLRLAGREVWNMYGPTETTIWSSLLKLEDNQTISIGQPINNTDIYILDKDLQVQPIGIIGELHIGGAGLARGYLNNPELTAQKFIPHPFKEGERLYKTGDLARWLPNGNVEFLGRVDHQLKIRGYRIEAKEIENLLIQHPQVKQAVVLAAGTGAHKELVSYYVPETSQLQPSNNQELPIIASTPQKGLNISLFHWGDTSMNKERTNPYKLLLEAAAFADKNGLEGIWIPERHFDPWGGQFPSPSVLAGAIASTTKRIKIRSGSVVAPLHHPIRIAENWSVVDNLSNGRVQMSFASGWAKNDFVLKPENYKDRSQLIFDYLEIVEKLWAGEQVAYPDPDGKEVLTEIFPKPIQPKLPAFVTVGQSPKSVIRAAQKGKFLLTHLLGKDWEGVRSMVELYRKTWKKAGHPGEGYVAVMVHTFIGKDSQAVKEIVEEPLTKFLKNSTMLTQKNRGGAEVDEAVQNRVFRAAFNRYYNEIGLFGTVEHCVKNVEQILDIGVNEIACLIDFGIAPQHVIEHLPYIEVFNRRVQEISKGKVVAIPPSDIPAPTISTEKVSITTDFRAYLKQALPSYMIPSAFIELEKIPLTASGKVNRKALPSPDLAQLTTAVKQTNYVAPESDVEIALVKLWSSLLQKEKIGTQDDFFDLGGHSLHAIRLIALIQKELNVVLSLIEIFTNSTISALGAIIKEKEAVRFQHIPKIQSQESYELSNAQRRIWVLNQLEEAEIAFNMPQSVKLTGQIDKKAMERSINLLFERHESLRTNIVKGQQIIHPVINFRLKTIDYTNKDRAVIQAHIQAHATYVFDLAKDVLLKMELLRVSADEHILLFNMHHIISDGWSMGILTKEFSTLYEAYKEGVKNPLSLLEPLAIQYKDFSAWQNTLLVSDKVTEHRQYWLEKLAPIDGQLPTLELPTDFPRPLIRTSNGASTGKLFDRSFLEQLQGFAQEQDTTLFISLTALLKVLFYRYTGQKDIIIGTPTAGRNHPDLYNQIGFYINTVVLRNQIDGQHSFKDFLQLVKQNALEAFDHEVYPFNHLVDELDLPKDMSRAPVFDVMIAIQNIEKGELALGTAALSEERSEVVSSKFDLTFNFTESDNGLHFGIEYNPDLFKATTIERFITHFERLIESVVADANTRIDQLTILPPAEQQLVERIFNDTAIDFPIEQTTIDLFEAQVASTPDQIAVVYQNNQLTYQQLNEKVNEVAHYLRANFGIVPNDIIPMYLERSEWMIIAILAIQKAGGAYLPIAANLPKSRILYMLEDCQPKVLLTDHTTHTIAETLSFQVPINQIEKITYPEQSNPTKVNTSTDLGYIIYTSGSTGKPKGVQGSHRGLMNRLYWMWNAYPFTANEVCCQKTNISFVDSISEIFEPLLGGVPIVIIPDETLLNPPKLIQLFQTHKVTRIILVPSLLKVVLAHLNDTEQTLPTLKHWATSGEALKLPLVNQLKKTLPNATLLNLYGSSEISDATYQHTESNMDKILIGKPTANMQVFIVDKTTNLVPIGVYGELYVTGKSLATGYLNKPTLTHQKFIQNPFGEGIIYKTGDLGRWLPDGNIEYFGRADHQLKIRGYRIEAGAVEQALLQHPAIQSAIVVDYQIETNKELVAYLIAEPEQSLPDIASLRRFLSQNLLPDYMIPSYFVDLEAFPRTAGGKINRPALPPPNTSNLATGTQYVAARNVTEQMLVTMWEEILDRSPISIYDDFSDMGGHSLRAIQLSTVLKEQYDLDIPLAIILQYPTIAGLATRIMEQKDFENQSSILYNPEAQPTVFALPSIFGLSMGYYELASACPETSWYSFDFLVAENRLALYYQEIKQHQPEGPYLFFGFSAGGNLAYEMVRYMEEKGDTVSDLIILDSFIFLAPTTFDFEEYIENIRNVENQTKEVLDILDNENIINQARARTSTYLDFLNNTKITGAVQANIHYLLADWEEGAEQWRLGKDWSIHTNGQYELYEMEGTHTQVFNKTNMPFNAKVIKDILTKINNVFESDSKELSMPISIK